MAVHLIFCRIVSSDLAIEREGPLFHPPPPAGGLLVFLRNRLFSPLPERSQPASQPPPPFL